jgi:hypothetical protein
MENLKAFVIVDPLNFDETVEEEVQRIISTLQLENIPVVLKEFQECMTPEMFHSDADIMIIDYGGISFGASDTAAFNIKFACKWAEDHPGKLLILWTVFTEMIYKNELEIYFGHLNNIVTRFSNNGEENFGKIKQWFGIK